MLSLAELKNGVNQYHGNLAFSFPVVEMASTGGTTTSVNIGYSGNMHERVLKDNLVAPTSVLGLGWWMESFSIVAMPDWNYSDGAITYYLNESGTFHELVLKEKKDSACEYKTRTKKEWVIFYFPHSDYFVITKENGSQYIFGDEDQLTGYRSKSVIWNNWVGNSAVIANQTAVTTAWHLKSVTDLWNNRILYTYNFVDVPVGAGGLSYTRAVYLSSVVSPTGQVATFNYLEKDANEFVNPDTRIPNSSQYKFEEQYLSDITLTNKDGVFIYSVRFDYDSSKFIASKSYTKRVLSGITTINAGHNELPGMVFNYESDSTKPGYGSLINVVTPDAGEIDFQYQTITPDNANVSVELLKPEKTGVSYSNPRFWIKGYHILVTWYGNDNSCSAQIYQWSGLWAEARKIDFSVKDLAAYNKIEPALSSFIVGFAVGTTLFCFRRSENSTAVWEGDTVGLTIDVNDGEDLVLSAQDSFISVLGKTSSKLNVACWINSAFVQRPVETLETTPGDIICNTASNGNYLFSVSINNSLATAEKVLNMKLRYLTGNHSWKEVHKTIPAPSFDISQMDLSASAAFAYLRYCGVVPSVGTSYVETVFSWPSDFSVLSVSVIDTMTLPTGTTKPSAYITNADIYIGQKLYRYDGTRWYSQDISSLNVAGQVSVTPVDVGFDRLVRKRVATDSNISYDVIEFNASSIEATGRWAAISGLDNMPSAAGTPVISLDTNKEEKNRYILVNNGIFYQAPDGTYTNIHTINRTFTGNDAGTACILQSGYLIYQFSGDTYITNLANGSAGEEIALTAQQIYTPDDMGGGFVGDKCFVTFSGSRGSGMSLKAWAVTDSLVMTSLSHTVIKNICCYQMGKGTDVKNGIQGKTVVAYLFDASTAVSNASGEGVGFNHATVADGTLEITDAASTPYGKVDTFYFNGLPVSSSPSSPYPTDGSNTNAIDYLKLLSGQLYRRETSKYENSKLSVIATNTSYIQVQSYSPSTSNTGYYSQIYKTESVLDNVPKTITYSYKADTGFPETLSSKYFDAEGTETTTSQTLTYGYEIYPELVTKNLLLPVVETVTQNNGKTVSDIITTWNNSWITGGDNWGEYESYEAIKSFPSSFNRWKDYQTPVAEGWQLTARVEDRNTLGTALYTVDTIGRVSSRYFDRSNNFLVSSYENCNCYSGECNFYGFEPYEVPSGWIYIGGSIAANIVTGEAFAGDRSLKVIPSESASKLGPYNRFRPNNQKRIYQFSSYIQTGTNFISVTGDCLWRISLYNGSSQVGNDILLNFTATSGKWSYISQLIDLPAVRKANGIPDSTLLDIHILAYNLKANVDVYVDCLMFSPIDASCKVQVYSKDLYLVNANLEENGKSTRYVRDIYNRVVSEVGAGNIVKNINAYKHSRSITAKGGYDINYPNSLLSIQSIVGGSYHNFEDSDADQWTLAQGFSMSGRKLAFDENQAGTQTPPLGSKAVLNQFGQYSFAAYVKVFPKSTSTVPNTGIGANNLYVYWDNSSSEKRWNLCYNPGSGAQTILSKVGLGYRNDILFLVVDNLVSFYVDGVEVFSYDLNKQSSTARPDGTFFLSLDSSGHFKDLLISYNPKVSLSFLDGAGENFQTLSFQDGNTILASGYIMNEKGTPAYKKNNVSYGINIDENLINGSQGDYLPDDPSGGQMSLRAYLSPQGGYQYEQYAFENSPLGRIKAIGQAGKNYSISSGNATTVTYTPHINTDAMGGIIPDAVAGNYMLLSIVNPNGVKVFQLKNNLGQVIAERIKNNGTTLTTQTLFNAAGQVIEVRPPNYFSPPAGTVAGEWIETKTYSFLGFLESHTTPAAGTTRYLSDAAGRIRFFIDALGSGLKPVRINYVKYDSLDRPLENGYIQDENITWSNTAAQVDNPNWPSSGVNYRWYKRLYYDYNPAKVNESNSAEYLVGRLWQVELNPERDGTTLNVVRYNYDVNGNITTKTETVAAYNNNGYLSTYRYDVLNNLTSITYPRLLGEDGNPIGAAFQVDYVYNRLGQLAGVGNSGNGDELVDPENPITGPEGAYAAYIYSPDGGISTEIFNSENPDKKLTRIFSRNEAGWVTSISGEFFSEKLTYDSGGYNGAKYYNGYVASSVANYTTIYENPETAGSFFNAVNEKDQWQYKYDQAGNILTAYNTKDVSDRSLSLGSNGNEIVYDPNGHLIEVPRGELTETYLYKDAEGQDQKGRVQSVTDVLSVTNNFSAGLFSGWETGASNKGPSASAIVDSPAGGGVAPSAKCLMLSGGAVGHYEYLQYTGYLNPNSSGKYTLVFTVKTGDGFSEMPGDSGWYIELIRQGTVVSRSGIQAIPSESGDWRKITNTEIDLKNIFNTLSLSEELTAFKLVLINAKYSNNFITGPALWITDISFSGSGIKGGYTYGANGCVTSIGSMDISSLTYIPETGQLATAELTGARALKLDQVYNDRGGRLYEKVTAGSAVTQKITLSGLDGQPLLSIVDNGNGQIVHKSIYGVNGEIAHKTGNDTVYLLKDNQKSTRVLVDKNANLLGKYIYSPYGEQVVTPKGKGVDNQFRENEYLKGLELYNFNQRLFSAALRRYLSPPYNWGFNGPADHSIPDVKQKGRALSEPSHPSLSSSVSEWVKDSIFNSRRNLHELNALKRQDLSLWDWLIHAPGWLAFPYTKFSPTEILAAGVHSVPRYFKTLQESTVKILANAWRGTMYAFVYGPMGHPRSLLATYAKKIILNTGKETYYFLKDTYSQIQRLNQEARDFRRDLAAQVWIKNSYRHSYWMCTFTKELGESFASDVGYAHEYSHIDLTIEGPYDSIIDKTNNLVGVKMGLINGGNCSKLVEQAWNDGALAWAWNYVDVNGIYRPVNSNLQRPLDLLYERYGEIPVFNDYDLEILRQENIKLPG